MHKSIYVTPVKQSRYTTEGKIVYGNIPISVFVEHSRRYGLNIIKCKEVKEDKYKIVFKYSLFKRKQFYESLAGLISSPTILKYFYIPTTDQLISSPFFIIIYV